MHTTHTLQICGTLKTDIFGEKIGRIAWTSTDSCGIKKNKLYFIINCLFVKRKDLV